nr:DJ-1/PfpI family protein [Rhizobium bangladeshense]
MEADVLRGRHATAWYLIRTDLRNAGSTVVDAEVVVDGNLITSGMPSDIPAFTKAIVNALTWLRKAVPGFNEQTG